MCMGSSWGYARMAMGSRNISQAHSSGPFGLETWTISIGELNLRAISTFINGVTGLKRKPGPYYLGHIDQRQNVEIRG